MNIVELENIGKKYILKYEKWALVKDVLPRLFIPKERKEFWAVKGMNLNLMSGESLGIIGHNGAGKSTLLNIIAGIALPTEGKVTVRGRLSTLLTLGAGFHPELTGEDNIYLNGVILGLKIREIKSRLNEIIEFSELKDFVRQPIYTYSSGMILRLGFSVAVHMDFEILLIDEILSVGDLPFQDKCIKKINEFKEKGKTLIIASQSLDLIKSLCHRALLLEKGRMVLFGEPAAVINRYLEMVKEKEADLTKEQVSYTSNFVESQERIIGGWATHIGTGQARITDVELRGNRGQKEDTFCTGEPLEIKVKYRVEKEIREPHFGVAIFRDDYLYCYGPNTLFDGIKIDRLRPGDGEFRLLYKKLILKTGDYRLSVAIWDEEEKSPFDYYCAYYKFKIFDRDGNSGDLIDTPCYLSIKEKKIQKHSSSLKLKGEKSGAVRFAEIERGRILDRWGRERNIFSLNDALEFSFSIKILEKIDSPLIWVGIESQDTLVQEACFKIEDFLNPGLEEISLFYPRLPLLRGKYSLSLGIGSGKEKESFQYFPEVVNCEFNTTKKDHGIVYMPHKWRIINP